MKAEDLAEARPCRPSLPVAHGPVCDKYFSGSSRGLHTTPGSVDGAGGVTSLL